MIIVIILSRSIKVTADQERFAVIALGQFKKLKGPGLLFKFFWSEVEWVKLRLGDSGELVSPEFGRFQDKDIPVVVGASTKVGSLIKIIGFEENKIVAHLDSEQRRAYVCEKCGHENVI
ncbi:MAG TPA: hypothetical protein VMW89_20540 [Desulfatiglandales bacterium]|nr:hypothetical protein [Desulfatiglandales bacterium]